MKIVVCVKQVPDTDDVKINRKTGILMRSKVPGILNPADADMLSVAAEFAEEVRKCGEEVSVTCVTMGPPQAEAVLREGMAYGAEKGILVCDPAFSGSDTFATSLILAAAIEKLGGISLVFTGKQSTDGETGHIGPQLAEHLGMTQVTMAMRVWWEKGLITERVMDGTCEWLSVELPAVISVIKQADPVRDLSIGSICNAYERPITVWELADLKLSGTEVGIAGSLTEVVGTFLPEQSLAGEILTGNMGEISENLIEGLYDRHILSGIGIENAAGKNAAEKGR